jgi:DNA-binding phage protein
MARVPRMSSKTQTTPYDVAEHLRTPEEMAAYLDA